MVKNDPPQSSSGPSSTPNFIIETRKMPERWIIAYLTRTRWMVFFEIIDTLIFTQLIISTLKNTLTKHFTVCFHTRFKIYLILIIQFNLQIFFIYSRTFFELTPQEQIGLWQSTHPFGQFNRHGHSWNQKTGLWFL